MITIMIKENILSRKKAIHYCLFFALLYCCTASLNAQSIKKANEHFDRKSYPKAAKIYEQILSKGENTEAKIKLGECYRLTRQYESAEYWYEQIVAISNIDPAYKYNYGMILKANGKYDQALLVFQEYNEAMPADTRGEWQIAACQQAKYFLDDPGTFMVNPINQNTTLADFGPAFYKEGIVFTSESNVNNPSNLYDRRDAPFLDLFYAKQIDDDPAMLGTPQLLIGAANSNRHDGVVSFSQDFQKMYFTGNDDYNSKNRKDNIVKLNLYLVEKQENVDEWGDLQHFPYNNPNYSIGHPSLSYDEQTLYFVSDMPGGYGGTDIYVSYKVNDEWDYPKNLGAKINTEGNEMFPYISETNVLYFSSDALPGLGGLDIFSTTKVDDENWNTAENLRYPINSNGDDFSFIIDEVNERGYFASSRSGGTGNDDIYSFTKKQSTTKPTAIRCQVIGTISEKNSNRPIFGVTVKLINSNIEESVLTDGNGQYSFMLDPNSEYTLYATKEAYFTEVEHISTNGRDCSSPLQQDMTLDIRLTSVPSNTNNAGLFDQPIKIVDRGENSHPDLPLPNLNPIYYDLNQSFIREDAKLELDKVANFMRSNPTLIVELGSHTDSRGDAAYNQTLSEARARAAMEYVVSRGVSRGNITAQGYGETQILNGCLDGVNCNEDQHQYNRRTEFIIIGYKR